MPQRSLYVHEKGDGPGYTGGNSHANGDILEQMKSPGWIRVRECAGRRSSARINDDVLQVHEIRTASFEDGMRKGTRRDDSRRS